MNRILFTFLLSPILLATCSSQQKHVESTTNAPTKEIDSSVYAKVVQHVDVICTTSKPRNHKNIEILDSVALYIFNEFSSYCDTVYYQTFKVKGKTYRNVIGVLHPKKEELIVIGAHYDVCGDTPGADDNASGIAGMLETGRLLSKKKSNQRIELVAFTLEEPPYFRTENMGSYQYASKLKKENAKLKYMLCLEMIGYFSDDKNSQEYPVAQMKQMYGEEGDFLLLVDNDKEDKSGYNLFQNLDNQSSIEYEYLWAVATITGVDFSDHQSFWKLGFRAFMITDTSFYRNKHYHEKSDKPSQLNYNKISLFVVDLVNAI